MVASEPSGSEGGGLAGEWVATKMSGALSAGASRRTSRAPRGLLPATEDTLEETSRPGHSACTGLWELLGAAGTGVEIDTDPDPADTETGRVGCLLANNNENPCALVLTTGSTFFLPELARLVIGHSLASRPLAGVLTE